MSKSLLKEYNLMVKFEAPNFTFLVQIWVLLILYLIKFSKTIYILCNNFYEDIYSIYTTLCSIGKSDAY
jgi:hypothetical protein